MRVRIDFCVEVRYYEDVNKEQTRRHKISQTMKGRIPKNLSMLHLLPRTDEWKKNMSIAHIGKKHTKETKLKCGLANKGKTLTKEHREKISLNSARYWLGKPRPFLGELTKGKFGKEHPRWVENKKSSLQKSIRSSQKYHQYKATILKRDNFACVLCDIKRVYLELDHHPKGFAQLLKEHIIQTYDEAMSCDELWQIENGRTVCQPCHETTDNFPQQLKGKRKYHTTS